MTITPLKASPKWSPTVLSSTQQLKSHQTSSVAFHLPAQRWRSWTSSFGGKESHSQWNQSSTSPVYCQSSYTVQNVGRPSRSCRINALHHWCLQFLFEIKCSVLYFVSNDKVQRRTNQPTLSEISQPQHLTLFGHTTRIDDRIDAKLFLTLSSPADLGETLYYIHENVSKWPGLPQTHMDWSSQLGSELTALEATGD